MDRFPPVCFQTGDLTRNQDMCLDQAEIKPTNFWYMEHALTVESNQPSHPDTAPPSFYDFEVRNF